MKNVQDIYVASPMQEFMLLHTLGRSENDSLFNQFCYTIDQPLDTDAFQRAWQCVTQKHDALRTAFVWEKVRHPQQVVRSTVNLPFAVENWSDLAEAEQGVKLEALLLKDRQQPFSPKRAPLMRFTLIQLAAQRWYFVWSSHHLILDRWCLPTVFADFYRAYSKEAGATEVPAAKAPSFRRYVEWIARQDVASAKNYWRRYLRGFDRATSISVPRAEGEERSKSVTEQLDLGGADYVRLTDFSRSHGLTVGAVVQVAWAIVLNRLTGSQDVVFGAAVSGRPAEIPQVEDIVGSFINNVPVRASLYADQPLFEFLRAFQSEQMARSAHDYLSPASINALSAVGQRALYDILLVWLAGGSAQQEEAVRFTPASASLETAFSVTLSVEEHSDKLAFYLSHRESLVASGEEILSHLVSLIEQIAYADESTCMQNLSGFVIDASFRRPVAETGPADAYTNPEEFEDQISVNSEAIRDGRENATIGFLKDMLASQWSDVLGAAVSVAETDDFFTLGGSSLQAAALHTRVEAAIRKSLPLLSLFERPTLEGMANTLQMGNWPLQQQLLTPLRQSRGSAPLFCIASPEVNTIGYSLLTRHLADDQSVYVIQGVPDGQSLRQLHPSEIEGLARLYVQAIRKAQPQGPYRFLSMCAGSHITLEIVRLLEADSQAVEFAGIINTWSLYTVSKWFYVNRAMNVMRYYRNRIKSLLLERVGSKQAVMVGVQKSAVTNDEPRPIKVLPAEGMDGLDNPWIRDVGFEHRDPQREKLTSTVTVLRLNPQQFWRIKDPGLGWSKFSRNVDIVHLEGDDHDAIMREPRVQELAAVISGHLRR